MKFSEYNSYFETAAINHKLLLHDPSAKQFRFFRMNIDQILEVATPSQVKDIALVLENMEKRTSDNRSDNIKKMILGAYIVVKQVKPGDVDGMESALDLTEEISEDIASKIMNDYRKTLADPNYLQVIKGFDPASLRFQKVGPLWDNFHGWRVEFTIDQRFNKMLQLDQTKWNNEIPFTP